ncbi:MAG: hypothetical protein ABSD97_06315 [Acidimicrobiales bacterium]
MTPEIDPGVPAAEGGGSSGGAQPPSELSSQASVVDLVAAALRADTADLDSYHRVLSSTVSDMLPVGMVEVDRERSMKDRMAGREGRATSIRIRLGELTLELVTRHGGLVATASREVRGVVISRQEISIAEWTQLLAQHLAKLAAESADARSALAKLLGEG